jgi:hypothetical protein
MLDCASVITIINEQDTQKISTCPRYLTLHDAPTTSHTTFASYTLFFRFVKKLLHVDTLLDCTVCSWEQSILLFEMSIDQKMLSAQTHHHDHWPHFLAVGACIVMCLCVCGA